MPLTCIIVDDEPLAVRLLETFVNKTPELELLASFTDSVEAINAVKQHAPNLLFLDIQMPDLNGMELAHMIPQETRIIFTTAFKEYAFESYEVSALDFLLKPIRYNKFLAAIEKARQWFSLTPQMPPSHPPHRGKPSAQEASPTGGRFGGSPSKAQSQNVVPALTAIGHAARHRADIVNAQPSFLSLHAGNIQIGRRIMGWVKGYAVVGNRNHEAVILMPGFQRHHRCTAVVDDICHSLLNHQKQPRCQSVIHVSMADKGA